MIPLVRPEIPAPEEWLTYYQASRDGGQYSNFGPCERLATERLRALTGRHVVLTSSGTASLQAILAPQTAFAPPGTKVGVPDFTFAATDVAVRMVGFSPVVMPCGADGLPLVSWVESQAPRFFIVTAPFGCDPHFERYDDIAQRTGRHVFYDCAGGWGLDFRRTANPVAISFHATKNLPIGEGGAVLFAFAEEVGPTKMAINFVGANGFNGKMSEIHAAILCAQLEPKNLLRAEQRTAHRKVIIGAYTARCDRLRAFATGVPSLCTFVDTKEKPQEIIEACSAAGIASKRGYWPLIGSHQETHADLVSVVALPSAVTLAEVDHITSIINKGIK